jgi:hypothetical protein
MTAGNPQLELQQTEMRQPAPAPEIRLVICRAIGP